MIIDSKLPGLKNYLSENRLNNGGVKTSINHSAIAASEQNNVDLELKDSTHNSQDSYSSKKEENAKKDNSRKEEEKIEKVVVTEAEVKTKNLKLLNSL